MTDPTMNLSNFQNLTVIKGSTPDELKEMLDQIRLPFRLVSIVAHQGMLVAFIVPSRPIRVKQKKPKEG